MFKKLIITILILYLLITASISSDPENQLGISITPHGAIPVGSSIELFGFGYGADASVSFIPGFLQYIGAQAGFTYTNQPLSSANSINVIQGWAGPVARYPFTERLSVYAAGKAGYYYWAPLAWDAEGVNGGGFTAGGGAGALFRITGPLTLGANVSYEYLNKLYNGISVNLAVNFDFPGLKSESIDVEIDDIRIIPLFPVLYGYYSNHPIGTVKVRNTGNRAEKDINIQFYLERYMDNPMKVGSNFDLAPGEEKDIDLFALFTEDLMQITEGTKASALISATKTVGEKEITKDFTGVIDFYNRNALSWTDNRRIASFMTAKDPEIMNFSKNVMTWVKSSQNPAIDENLQKAMAMFEALKNRGVSYEVDPATPFREFSEESASIDFLQFPRQTLQYTNGDCDDLTTLYCTLLESVGVETAFITVPGHIYAAFTLKMGPDEAQKTFLNPDELILTESRAWVPVEITMFQESFERAWAYGAKEWRQYDAEELSVLYPVREAWQTFQAVGFRDSSTVELPDRPEVTTAFMNSINRHVDREIHPQIEQIRKKIDEGGRAKTRWQNKLGVVYARYGLYDKASEAFETVLQDEEYIPALNNLGGIYFLKEKYEKALEYYDRALQQDDSSKAALLGTARCSHELENYYLVKKTYARLAELDSQLAEQYAYLDMKGAEATRAAAAEEMKYRILWEDE